MHRSSFGLPPFVWKLLLAAAILAVAFATQARAGDYRCPQPAPAAAAQPQPDSWVFMRSRYSHDPQTGARVAQYDMKPAIEPLDDPRLVTSGYSRTRTVVRGADGSVDTHYRVTSYGNGRGGLDAEWERFHDAWRGSTVAGGDSQSFFPPFGNGFGGFPGPIVGGGGPWGWWNVPPGLRGQFNRQGYGFGPGFGQPDPGRLDPDGADGFQEQQRRTPDREFFNGGLPPRERRPN